MINDCAPNSAETHLLHAVSDANPQATGQRWTTLVNLDDVTPAAYHLLPHVYRRLVSADVEDPQRARLKGVYQHTWGRNHLLLSELRALQTAFAQHGVSFVLLRAAAMGLCFYEDVGVRLIPALDIAIAPSDGAVALEQIAALGWQSLQFPNSPDRLQRCFEQQLYRFYGFQKGDWLLNIHRPIVNESLTDLCESTWQDRLVHHFNPTDQLIDTCLSGSRWQLGYLSWIPDALHLLRHHEIAWEALVERVIATRLIVPVRAALGYLAAEFQAPIPILDQLDTAPVTWLEQREFDTLSRQQPNPLWRDLCHASRERANGKPLRLSPRAWAHYRLRVKRLPQRPLRNAEDQKT